MVLSDKESPQCRRCSVRSGRWKMGQEDGSGRSPSERNGNSLQYSCPGNPMDKGAWQTTVLGVAKASDAT